MRKIILTGLLVLGGFGVARSSEGVDEILKLAAAGVGEEVLLAFVETSPVAYDISADEIIQLKDLGLPQTVLAAMLTHGTELRKKAAEAGLATANAANPPAPPQEQAVDIAARTTAPEVVTQPPPTQNVVITQPPAYQPLTQLADPNAQPVYSYQPAVDTTPTTMVLDTAPVVAPPPDQYTTTFFYDALSPYGTWTSDPGYGWVWEPAAVRLNPTWRPYCDGGYWVWSDYGWYWQSDYSWGWAPFHYGRWAYVHHRWCWIPGHRWAPSWVYWRSHDDGYGWAPLPPGSDFDARLGFTFHGKNVDFSFGFNLSDNDYVFVPRQRFLDHRLNSCALPRRHVTDIYNHTTVINNTYVYNDNRIINNGIPVNSLAEVTKQRIQPVRIEDARFKPGDRIHGDRRDGDRIVAFRPEVQDKVTELPPAVTQRRLASIPPTKRVTLAAPREIGKAGPAQIQGPGTANLVPATTRTPPTAIVKPPAGQEPVSVDRGVRKPPTIVTNPEGVKSTNTQIKQPADETRRRIETETGKVDSRPDREKPPISIDRRGDEKLQAEQDARRKAEAAQKAQSDAAQLEAVRLQAETEAAKKTRLDATRKLQQDAAQQQALIEAARKAELDAARRKADVEAQAKAQRDAALEAAKRKVEADAEAIKMQKDAARQAQLEALRKAEQDAGRRKVETDWKAQRDAAQQQAQIEAARKVELEAARQKSQGDAELKLQRDAVRQRTQTEAPRAVEQEPLRRRVEVPTTKQPGVVTPPVETDEEVTPQSVDEKARRNSTR